MGKPFNVRKVEEKEPIQVIEVRNLRGKISPRGLGLIIEQVDGEMFKDLPVVFNFGREIPEWAQAMMILNLETVNKPWVGIYRRAVYADYCDVVVISSNLENLQVGNTIPLVTLGLESR